MAFANIVTVKNDQTYQISPDIKAFSLLDLGFIKNNAGTFSHTIALEPAKGFASSRKLKLTFAKDLSGFKIALLSGNEALNVDIFSDSKDQALVEQYHYQMQQLLKRKVIMAAED
ncbi:DUF1831 domain-containing protein [Oenococcus sicerae]|uniref:DUF1831 domain-containing protein n=1 Tax=Oenococcus sicerae TaxID=2203724 RepID=A0AAJ1R8S2_9LACO|nr:hypothetical protein [Oenococcus sicerae]MDN6899836.1 hypothetical protein [Oenococcus sicerae]QAS70521.1 DUF1831 domain-containing protein [Oenococcus sicerae]VDK13923.1 hypothetical protein OAL24_00722 [Oenococcus sicerae]